MIELTSKPLKLQSVLSSILLLGGILLLFTPAAAAGILLAIVGLVWKVVTQIRIWWNHG